jgi:hypothetical protein
VLSLPGRHRRDPWWDLDGRNVRRTRQRRNALGALALMLSIVLLALGAAHLPSVDMHELTTGFGRIVLMGALVLLLASCSLVAVSNMKGRVEA